MRSKVSSIGKVSGATVLRTMSILLSLASVSALGCRDGKKASQAKAIIGSDDRTEIKDANVLARLGLLNVGDHSCNATLIGPDVVITVVHCVNGTKLGNVDGFTFSTATGKIARVEKLIAADPKKDLAVYKLDTGKFDYFTPSLKSAVDQGITVAGYDITSGKWVQSTCTIKSKEAEAAALTYECDTVPGMSGSAILSHGEVLGLHVAHNPNLNKNLGLDFASISNPTADLASLPQNKFEAFKMPCICCHGCDIPSIPTPPSPEKLVDQLVDSVKGLAITAVANEAKERGYNLAQCNLFAVPIVNLATAKEQAAFCATATVVTAGLGAPACAAMTLAASTALASLSCYQACVDGHIGGDCHK